MGSEQLRRHLKCEGRLHVTTTRADFPKFESGFWDIEEGGARELVGGMLYLHETKAEPSYFGREVLGYRVAGPDEALPVRIVFTMLSRREGRGVAWERTDHQRAWDGGNIR